MSYKILNEKEHNDILNNLESNNNIAYQLDELNYKPSFNIKNENNTDFKAFTESCLKRLIGDNLDNQFENEGSDKGINELKKITDNILKCSIKQTKDNLHRKGFL